MTFYINAKKESAGQELAYILDKCIQNHTKPWEDLVLLCIGSDRITGDSLGPYIGHLLGSRPEENVYVYGTLDHPVHALNLEKTVERIEENHARPLVIAIDASLGAKKHLGYITVGNGSIRPGAGVQKRLPAVGDIYITGIVNVFGFLEQFTLQTTRLSTVVNMANAIASGILYAYQLYCKRLMFFPPNLHTPSPEEGYSKETAVPCAACTEENL